MRGMVRATRPSWRAVALPAVGVALLALALALLAVAARATAAEAGDAPAARAPTVRCSQGRHAASPQAPLYTTRARPWDPHAPNERIPSQWLAKLYTEGLGCAPDQASYARSLRYVRAAGCSARTLRALAARLLTSRRFLHRPYDYGQRLLALWRIGRESEPPARRLARQLHALRSHRRRWPALVRSFLSDAGFRAAVPRLCSGRSYGWDAARPVIDIPSTRTHDRRRPAARCHRDHCRRPLGDANGAALQRRLDRAAPGATVWLARGAVVRIAGQVTIPRGVTLATAGSPRPRAYAAMARLIRTRITGRPLVVISAGAALASVWVDGQRSNRGIGIDHDSINVHVLGGRRAAALRNSRVGNTAGWSNVLVERSAQAASRRVTISGNLITGYSTKFHYYETTDTNDVKANQFGFADGISNSYGNSRIARNQFVDVTDVSVVVFKDFGTPSHQRSVVTGNTIVNAGNSGWAAFTVDPLYPSSGHYDFSGTRIDHNLVWASPNAFLLMIAGIGTKPWFGDSGYGYGSVRFTHNTTGRVRVNTQMAIGVSRMSGAIVRGNRLLARLAKVDTCPTAYIGVDESAGSRIRPRPTPVTFPWNRAIPSVSQGCIVLHQ